MHDVGCEFARALKERAKTIHRKEKDHSLAQLILEKLHSIYDLDLFSLNTGIDTSTLILTPRLNQHFRSL